MKKCSWCGCEFTGKRQDAKYCSVRCGNAFRAKTHRGKSDYNEKHIQYKKTPQQRFNQHKNAAKSRGIEFLLTFEEWWEIWMPFWELRGKGGELLCMGRHGDKGAYEVGNVKIITMKENMEEWRQR